VVLIAFLVGSVVLPGLSASAVALPGAALRYTLRFPAPHTHYVDVEATLPTEGRARVDLMMPVWTPGSYLVREYSRNVEALVARAGTRELPLRKTRKNHWEVTTGSAASITLTYRVYARQMAVQGNWVDADFAMLNGAPTFITVADRQSRPHEIQVELPPGWRTSVSPLPAVPGAPPNHYVAADYDTLVDSPLVAGTPTVHEFQVAGKQHYLVNVGEAGVWDGPRSAQDVKRLVEANLRFWGELPYDKYVFFNLLTGAGGGLEHKNSTVMMTTRWATGTRESYLRWLGLVSHEYFHTWNVKRLRPVELGPFDYDNEVYTTGLWVSEGFTDYYGDLLLRHAELATPEQFLEAMSRQIAQLQGTPGRLAHPLSQSSYDAWIKAYRADENSPNTTISYYTKGGVVAFLLDARVRAATRGTRSLDDVMRLAYRRYAGTAGFTADEFRSCASEVAGTDLGTWFSTAIDSTEDLDYSPALDWFGLRFKPAAETRTDRGWLGVHTRVDNGRVLVTQVRRGTPAYDAGLNVDDELVAIDGFRVRAEPLDQRLQQYRPGQKVTVLVARREQMRQVDVTLGTEPNASWRLEPRPDATPEQRVQLDEWLSRTVR
jgi:predicted metalloprotease with PDZ domain